MGDNDRVAEAVEQSWREGYQQAVDALRSIGREFFGDPKAKGHVEMLALMLEKMRP